MSLRSTLQSPKKRTLYFSQTKASSISSSFSTQINKLSNPQVPSQQNFTTNKKKTIKQRQNIRQNAFPKIKINKNIKSTYKVTKIIYPSHFFTYSLIIWMVFFIFMIILTISQKISQDWLKASQMQIQCKQDFYKNRCQLPLKDLINYCQQKSFCMKSSVQHLFTKKLNISGMLGQILNEFFKGAGLWVTLIGLIIITLSLIFGKKHTVIKQFTQYN